MKISKERLKEIIKEELDSANLEKAALHKSAMDAIEAITDEDAKTAILAYISSLQGEVQ